MTRKEEIEGAIMRAIGDHMDNGSLCFATEAVLENLKAAGYVIERGWQPIEEARKDGSYVIGFSDEGVDLCYWKDKQNIDTDDPGETHIDAGFYGVTTGTEPAFTSYGKQWPARHQPTHFRPLPSPPEKE